MPKPGDLVKLTSHYMDIKTPIPVFSCEAGDDFISFTTKDDLMPGTTVIFLKMAIANKLVFKIIETLDEELLWEKNPHLIVQILYSTNDHTKVGWVYGDNVT